MNFVSKFFERRRAKALEISQALEEKRTRERLDAQERERLEVIMQSDVPWYKLIGDEYDIESPPKTPISERYKWNKAFITNLREEGFRGETDVAVIEAWEKRKAEEKAKRLIELERKRKKDSSEPWVEIVSEHYDEISKQVEIKLDWNKAFITMLRKNGYTGSSEQEIVDKYFKRLSEDIAKDIHETDYDS